MEGYGQCFALLLLLPYAAGVVAFSVRGARSDPAAAALLNFLLPGIGYAYLGRWIRFLGVAGPLILLLGSNLFGELRAIVEPVRLLVARRLSFGGPAMCQALIVLLWIGQIIDAARVAGRDRSMEQSKPGESATPAGGADRPQEPAGR
jgi:hypothetical protein